jgi:two-component system, NarL family, nitrate/nitrite response regulator NarL
MTTVFIVSSSPASRQELRRLAESSDVRVVGEGGDVDVARAAEPRADVLLLDDGSLLDGVEDGEDELWPAIVLLTGEAGLAATERLRALDPRGWAVLQRGPAAAELRAAVLAAGAGLAVMATETFPAVPLRRRDPDGDGDGDSEDDLLLEPLTAREQEVLDLLGLGLSNKDIGVRLGISEHTAKFHVASVLAKLGAHTRAEAVRRGIRRGLVAV